MVEQTENKPGVRAIMNNVLRMVKTPNTMELIVMKPCEFEEMPQVLQALREYKSVLLNLTMMEAQYRQRSVDFVAGGTYSMQGNLDKISESIFLFTPSGIEINRLS